MSRQNAESLKPYVSRRRRCWTLLVQMDPVIHLSEGHRSDMLLDLSGLTREERVMVQASISDERDFDRVAVGFAGKVKANTLAAENPENLVQMPVTRATHPLKSTIMMTTL